MYINFFTMRTVFLSRDRMISTFAERTESSHQYGRGKKVKDIM